MNDKTYKELTLEQGYYLSIIIEGLQAKYPSDFHSRHITNVLKKILASRKYQLSQIDWLNIKVKRLYIHLSKPKEAKPVPNGRLPIYPRTK